MSEDHAARLPVVDTRRRGPEGATAATSAEPWRADVAQPRREVWANVGHPFASGLLLTIGGLVAFALGVAFINLSTIVIYIVMALFVALALDPVVRRLERRRFATVVGHRAVYGSSRSSADWCCGS